MNQKIKLYSMATPNGKKVSIALEEMGLEYEPILVNIRKGEQLSDWFQAVNPHGKIPVIVDPCGPEGKPITIVESGAILWYLAEKSGKFLPESQHLRYQTMQWLCFQMSSVGPMFGQFVHFFSASSEMGEQGYALERFKGETQKIIEKLNRRLDGRPFLVGDTYTIADMACVPWVQMLETKWKAWDFLGFSEFPHVSSWVERVVSRPLTAIGMKVCSLT